MSLLQEVARKYHGKQYSNYVAIRCPFHNDHNPSMLVTETGYRCLSCGAFGKDVEELLDRNSAPAKEFAYDKLPPHVPPEQLDEFVNSCAYMAHEFPFLFEYLIGRGIPMDSIKRYHIGFKAGWFVFPVRQGISNVRVVFRASPSMQAETGVRYVSHGASTLYVPDQPLLLKSDHMIVVFGILDAVSLAANGLPAVTPTNGKGSVQASWFENYRKKIYVVPDVGEEGAGLRLVQRLGWRGKLCHLPYTDLKDPNDYITRDRIDDLKSIIYRR